MPEAVPALDKAILKNSRFAHLFARDGRYCLMHSLTLHKVYGDQILAELFEAFREPVSVHEAAAGLEEKYTADILRTVLGDLREKGLLVPDNRDDLKIYVELFERGMRQNKIQHMYFIPTTGCNLRCRYCFVEDEDRHFTPAQMSLDTAKKGLEVFAALSAEAPKITITFYGGEPLQSPEATYFAMKYVRTLEARGDFRRPVVLSLLTNGELVDDRTVEVVRETGTKVSVSIDGPEKLHDTGRVDVSGKATFGRAVKGFRILQDAGLAPGISCTLTRFNTEHTEKIAEFFVRELKPSGMGFNILLPRVNSKNPLDVDHEFAAGQLIAAFKILRKHGIYEDRVMRRVRPFTEAGFHLKDCMGVGGQIVISPDGKIGPCQAYLGLDEYFPLSVDQLHARLPAPTSADIYQNPMFEEWLHRFPINMMACTDCHAISICGGGCPYASQVTHRSIWEVDERVCSQAKQIMEWMIWDTYEHLLARHEEVGQVADTRQD